MSSSIPFTKMHGAGNDYIYVNVMDHPLDAPSVASRQWSAPHTGIGSDGLVLIGAPAEGVDADFSMRIFNADGSEAMMCGNASRCIGKYLYERRLTNKTTIRLETRSGIKTLMLHLDDEGNVDAVTVDMLSPVFHLPEQFDETCAAMLANYGFMQEGVFVSMGNPHFVTFVDNVEALDIRQLGHELEHHPAFPQRCNIEFAQLTGTDSLRTRVWERGSGITMACGTGACATAVAAALTSRCSRFSVIDMDGGQLRVEWRSSDNHVYMTGPAQFVFDGVIAWPQQKD